MPDLNTETMPRGLSGKQRMRKPKHRLLGISLPALLMLAAFVSGSCGGGDSYSISVREQQCDLTSQRNEQRRSGEKREDYYPNVFSRDFRLDYDADISPTDEDYDTARKISRSVFELESREGDSPHARVMGSAWLAAPRHVITAAHNIRNTPEERIFIRTFEGGNAIETEVVYFDPEKEDATDLALLRIVDEEEIKRIDAVPLKIATKNPERNDFLMAIGSPGIVRGLGGWTVSAGPALELKSEYTGCPVSNADCRGRIYHAVPTAGGNSGGPVLNRSGEVVSLASTTQLGRSILREAFGITPKVRTKPVERLWIYAFVQPDPNSFSYGPNPMEIRKVFEMIPPNEKPDENREYRDDNEWERTSNEFGNEYSPFPFDQFDRMQEQYIKAREAAVRVSATVSRGKALGSGFIYDENTVITAGHVTPNQGRSATIETRDGKRYSGIVSKTQCLDQGCDNRSRECDIAVIEMDESGALSGYPTLEIAADSSSLKCGDPVVEIGSAGVYNSVGYPQGVGAVYTRSTEYVSEFISHLADGGMSGGPIIDKNGEVVSLSSRSAGRALEEGEWIEPGPLLIRTRLPVYRRHDFSEGPRAEIIKRFVEEDGFFCPAR